MNRRMVVFILLFFNLISQFYVSTATYVDDEHIVILRSQFVDIPSLINNGKIDEAFWSDSGLLSLKIAGSSSQDAQIDYRFANDDNNLYFAFILLNYFYVDLSVVVYFDTDNDGVLSTPEDGKLISFSNGAITETVKDLYWDGNSWLEDSNQDDNGYDAGAYQTPNTNNTGIEMTIPLLSSDIAYDGLQIPSTSNSYIGMIFSIVNNFNNGTIETFEFPTNPSNASGYVDLRLAGPEDKDLPSYVPPVQITTTITSADTFLPGTDTKADAYSEDSASSINLYLVIIGVLVSNFIIRRRR